ncbi:dynamin family protein [Paenibacillus ihumii]|uniref:dynamin family protein n=1 Tax=Paenibacillus ihumii TaxID=687436 RepID=UPI0006D7D37A|nr:dynamin family protein [Paenibacillus ihumii]
METLTIGRDQRLHDRLDQFLKLYESGKDLRACREIQDLQQKLAADELTLSFCGHFSAGKSSLINRLCGKQVLPSGPIPTTANVAAIRNGEPRAVLTRAEAAGQGTDATAEGRSEQIELNIDQLDDYCRDGNTYSMISLWDDVPILGQHGVLLDTPGVDSNDAGHAMATNSALHLADVVFYVMDYNHVLSESNLSFAKRLADWGKPLYLVVNQIDKHRNAELSFEKYRRSVEDAFELWGIVPAGVFYISLRELSHPLNMLSELEKTITALFRIRQSLLEFSIGCSLFHGAEQYLKRLNDAEGEEQERLLEEIGGEEALQGLQEKLSALEREISEQAGLIDRLRDGLTKELDGLLANAHVMTPELREAAALYLESRKPGFKTGLWFHGSKTEREKERRKEYFLGKLKEQTQAQVDWHVRDLLRRLGQSEGLWNAEWESRLEAELPQAEEEWIAGPAREGALLSGEYTLRYAADVAAGIAGRYRRAALAIADGLLAELEPRLRTARQDALRGGRFTVALFGAFSAGKSSFANALLGAQVLPVSPHPTTAAINRILAPEGDMKHGQAAITFKSMDAMREDLAYSFEALQLGAWKEGSWRSEVTKLKAPDVPPSGRAHFSFLKAAAIGWEQNAARLGSREITGLEQFAEYVAEESMACFVAGIDLYYSCPLTEQGIVIVDTPGADSIHARHTGVTFEYMKNSDALLYVTYYNHAFSRADRQFLGHLGRVKGSFALDKMFFIVNAADLASTPEELASVVEHVEDGLRAAGIESPQIYPVSSIAALEAKRSMDAGKLEASGFSRFEIPFLRFISEDLAGLAVGAARHELQQFIARAEQWTETLAKSEEEREQLKAQLLLDHKRFSEELRLLAKSDKTAEITQETGELLFHVRRRLQFLAGDLFHEYFHPSLLQDDGGDMKRKFAASVKGWLAQLSIELEREVQATSLRLEKKCEALLAKEAEAWLAKLEQEIPALPALSIYATSAWLTPSVPEGSLEHGIKASSYWSYFRNPKTFFEGGGKQKLRDALEEPLSDGIKVAVERCGEDLIRFYAQETSARFAAIAASFEAQWEEWESSVSGMSDAGNTDESWKDVPERLLGLYQALH